MDKSGRPNEKIRRPKEKMSRTRKRIYAWFMAFVVVLTSVVSGKVPFINSVRADSTTTYKELDKFPLSVIIKNPDGTKVETDSSGKYMIKSGALYQVELVFSENKRPNYQLWYGNGDQLEYSLPDGVSVPSDILPDGYSGTTKPLMETGDSARENYYLTNCNYLVKDGKLTFTYDYTNDHNYTTDQVTHDLNSFANFHFTTTFLASFDNSKDEIDFGNDVKVKVTPDNSKTLDVTKSAGSFDRTTGEITYTVTIKGTGNNENVAFSDVCSNYMTIDSSSVEMSIYNSAANTTTNATSSLTNLSAGQSGLSGTIPLIRDGETAKITYKAKVDIARLSADGKASVSGGNISFNDNNFENTFTITPSDTENTKDSNGETSGFKAIARYWNGISYEMLGKTGVATEPDSEGKSTITWTVVMNSYPGNSLANTTVTDTFNSEYMENLSTASDVTIVKNVKKNNGWSYSTESSSNYTGGTLTMDTFGKGWTYTIGSDEPSENEYFEYVLTYKTVVDASTFTSDTTMNNGVSASNDYGSYGVSGTATVKSTVSLGIEKENTSVSEDSMGWKVTVTVPADGISSSNPVFIEDIFPRLSEDYTNWSYIYDSYGGDLNVSGLESTESTSIEQNSDGTGFKIYFKNGSDNGFAGTGSERKIVITYKTNNNSDWVTYFKQNKYGTESHTNTVNAYVNGTSVSNASATGTMTKAKEMEKNFGLPFGDTYNRSQGYFKYTILSNDENKNIEINDYAFYFNISLTSVDDSVFDDSGNLKITDTFDSDLFEVMYYNVPDWQVESLNPIIIGSNSLDWKRDAKTAALQGSAIDRSTDGKVVFTLNKDKLPKYNNGYFPYYVLQYRLKVKDAAAMAEMAKRAMAASDDSDTVTFKNNAKVDNDNYGSDSADYSYTINALSKSIGAALGGTTRSTTFSIDVNPDGIDLNSNGDTLEITDTYQNLTVSFESIKVVNSDTGKELDSSDVTYDASNNGLKFYVPDATPLTITYKASIVGSGEVYYNNTAKLYGKTAVVDGTSTFSSGSSAGGSTVAINILKYQDGDMTKPLEGVQFQLFDSDKNPMEYSNGDNIIFTTNANGKSTISTDTTKGLYLSSNTKYYIQEIKSSVPSGYMWDDTYYEFKIVDDEDIDYNTYKYHNGDVMTVKNITTKVSIPIRKIWKGEEGTQATFRLYMEDTNGNKVRAKDVNGNIVEDLVVNKNSSWEGTFTNLERYHENSWDLIKYSVEEINVPAGYTASGVRVDSSSEKRIDRGYVFTNTEIQNGTLNISKNVVNGNDADRNYEIKVTSVARDDLSSAVIGGADSYNISEDKATITGYIKDGATLTISNLPYGEYRVTETRESTDTFTTKYAITDKVSGETDGNSVVACPSSTNNVREVTVTNTYQKETTYTTVSASKEWKDIKNATLSGNKIPNGASVVFTLYKNGVPTSETVTLDGTVDEKGEATAWTATFFNLEEKDSEGKVNVYTVEETTGFDGYTKQNSEPVANGGVITNKENMTYTSVSATKAWKNLDGSETAPNNASVIFELYADGSATGNTVTLDGTVDTNGESAAWVASFADLPKYTGTGSNVTEVTYTVVEKTGYTGYTAKYADNNTYAVNGGTITNKQDMTYTSISASKKWQNANGSETAPNGASVTFTLYADGSATEKNVTLDGTADENGESAAWKASFTNLPKYSTDTGALITYTIKETDVAPTSVKNDYSVVSDTPVGDNGVIVNKQAMPKVSISASKAWKNANGSTTAPNGASVVFKLFANNTDTNRTVTLDGTADSADTDYESDVWTATFTNLDKYDTEGSEITYTIDEDESQTTGVTDYSKTNSAPVANGGTITNKQGMVKTSVYATKAWKNADGTTTAPNGVSVTFELYADGSACGKTVTLDGETDSDGESTAWVASFTNLDKYDEDGNLITYTIKENGSVSGYTADKTEVNSGETITNTQNTVSVHVSKVDIADGEEIEGATIQILDKDGNVVKEWISGTTPYEVTGLIPGAEYTLKETVAPEGYTIATETTFSVDKDGNVTTTGTTTTDEQGNTVLLVEDAKTSVSVSKVDVADGAELEGATIQIITKDNGGNETVVEQWISGTSAHTITGLKTETEYILRETIAPGGYLIATDTVFYLDKFGKVDTSKTTTQTNSNGVLLVEDEPIHKVDVSATKAWKNADGGTTAPENASVTFVLYADGVKTDKTVVLDGTVDEKGESTAWKATFKDLPETDSEGKTITYTIDEDESKTTGVTDYSKTNCSSC